MEQGMLNGQQKQNLKGIASLGRLEDNHLAHVAQGERIIPSIVAQNNPKLIKQIDKSISKYGVNPNSFVVGNRNMEINPQTGLPEFGWLSKIAKKLKKVVKKIAPIAAVIPGPWQPFAVVYNKGNALNNIAKGDGSIFDVMTLGAGGSQKVFGDKGALANIKAGTGIGSLSNVTNALSSNVGSFMNAPREYLSNIGEQVARDQKAGYGGIFANVGPKGYGGQFLETTSSLANPLSGTGIMNTAGMGGQMMPVSQGSSPTDWLQQNFDPNDSITENGVQKFRSVTDGNYYTPDQAYQMYNNQSGFQRTSETSTSTNDGGGSFFGFKTPNFIKGIEDKAKGLVGGVTGTFKGKYDQDGNLLQAPTIDPKLLALALGYGKITRDAAIRQSGGMQDIRETLRPDLAQQEVYNPGGGFDVGLGNRSLLTMPMAPTQGMPIEASYETMPNAPVGTPMPERFIRGAANGGIIQAYAVGGQVIDMRNGGESEGPGTGTSDDIPAMLSDGEFVMTAKATRGAGAFDVAEQDGGIMLLPTGEASREKGTDNMTTLMETFARYG
jgi:hypothetical protein|tara:strand:- start:17627 stop:19285 length:1659 start_codon:yes stop_codon:yes gene_type:complete